MSQVGQGGAGDGEEDVDAFKTTLIALSHKRHNKMGRPTSLVRRRSTTPCHSGGTHPPGVAPSEGGSFVTVTVRARMCDVGGSFPRVRVGCCHQHVRMRMRCSTLFSLLPLLSFPPSPLLLGRVTLGDRTLLPRIIMPSSSSLASASPSSRPLLWTQILPGNIQGESHTLHKAFCGGEVFKRFCFPKI